MTNTEYVLYNHKEVTELRKRIDAVIEDYMQTSIMAPKQKLVNAGRALVASHVLYLESLKDASESLCQELLKDN